ncbi:hypothetical protein LB542_29035, partial [Mesorhizobium sp. BR1-1-9]|uniref:hypothetical protein n=1 Tax=Mesorhizobium sp. BR1-1-9 TaxID=2876646 RepID=UPI001CD0CC77
GARTGNCDQGRSGAEKKALDVHFLTSPVKVKNGFGFWLADIFSRLTHNEKGPHRVPFSRRTYPSIFRLQ